MMMYKKLLVFFALSTLILSACKKEVTPEDVSYKCECGSFNWAGVAYDLADAHWVTTATAFDDLGLEIITSKDYYTTAKIETGDSENGEGAHNVNLKLTIPNIQEGVDVLGNGQTRFFDTDSVDVIFDIQDVNFTEGSLSTIDEFVVISGQFTLVQENTNVDNIEFSLEVVRSVNGSAAGFAFPFNGTLAAAKEEI